jgi:hypothetical protein
MSDMSEQKHMEQLEAINLTKIAKEIHATTPNAKVKLERMGVKPIQEIRMPSGRVYTLYEAREARDAIEKINKERLGYDPAILEQLKKQHQESLESAKESKEDSKVVELEAKVAALEPELREMKDMMKMLLESLTKPSDKK